MVIDEYHFRNDLDIKSQSLENEEQNIIKITSRVINNLTITIKASVIINSEPGGHSTAIITLFINKQENNSYKIKYINGKASFDSEQGCYMPLEENELINLDQNDFIFDLNTVVDEYLPNKVEEIRLIEYRDIQEGGEVVADFICEECGELTVSINESLHQYGTCVNVDMIKMVQLVIVIVVIISITLI